MSIGQPTNTAHARARRIKNDLFGFVCLLAVAVGVLMLALLILKIARDGLGHLDLSFLAKKASGTPKRAGILTALAGSLWIMLLTPLIAVPIGVAAALFLEEFTQKKNWFTEFIQVNIANLAGVPSIVYGLLGLAIFVRWFHLKTSVMAGALTMAVLILPMIIIVSQEALKAVPRSYREGSLALGATRWQTIRLQVLPSALPGILTGIILSVSRAVGETAPLIVVGAAAYVTFLPTKPSDNYTVLPLQIFDWSSRPREEFHQLAASAIIVLLVVLLTMNSVAIYVRSRARK